MSTSRSRWVPVDGAGMVGNTALVFNPVTNTVVEQGAGTTGLDQYPIADNYSATGMEDRLDLYYTSGGKTVTLPVPTITLYRKPRISISNIADAGNWTVQIAGGATFPGGSPTVTLAPGDSLETYVVKTPSGDYRWNKV